MCDRSNAQAIVGEMLSYLETADYSIREEMVLKVAILAEKYATDYSWYVDTILMLIRVAGDYVSDEVWHRVVQIVVNREDVQSYAAKTVFDVSQLFNNHFGKVCLVISIFTGSVRYLLHLHANYNDFNWRSFLIWSHMICIHSFSTT